MKQFAFIVLFAFAPLLTCSCERNTLDVQPTVDEHVLYDFKTRFPAAKIIDISNQLDGKTDIRFTDKDGYNGTAIYLNGIWMVSEKAFNSDDFLYAIPREVAKTYIGTGIKNEDYPINYIKWYNRIFGICALGINKYILYTDYNYILLDLSLEIPKQCIIEKNKMDKYIYSNYEKLVKEYHRILFENEYRPSNPLVQENKSMFLPTEINRDKNLYNLENNNFKITSRFNSIMYMDLIAFMENNDKNEDNIKDKNKYLLVIENDWNNIIKSFPGAFIRNKYGH